MTINQMAKEKSDTLMVTFIQENGKMESDKYDYIID
jgi:hypothetical protein